MAKEPNHWPEKAGSAGQLLLGFLVVPLVKFRMPGLAGIDQIGPHRRLRFFALPGWTVPFMIGSKQSIHKPDPSIASPLTNPAFSQACLISSRGSSASCLFYAKPFAAMTIKDKARILFIGF